MLNNHFFLFFILSHFLGDFVFQTTKMAKTKTTNIKGLMMHSTIVFIAQLVLMAFFGIYGIFAAVIASCIHFIEDYVKTVLTPIFIRLQIILFVLDQLIHILVILILTMFLGTTTRIFEFNPQYVRLAITIVFLTHILTVAIKIILRDLHSDFANYPFFFKYERLIDALTTVLLWLVWHTPFYFSVMLIIIILFLYYVFQKTNYMYSPANIIIKYMFYITMSYLVYYFFLF